MQTQAEQQLCKVRQLAERRAKYQQRAEEYLRDMKAAGELFRYWTSMVKDCDAELRQIAASREP